MKRRRNKQDASKLPKQMAALEEGKTEEQKAGDEAAKGKVVVVASHHTPSVVSILQQNNIPLINNNDRTTRMGNMDLAQLGTSGKKGEEGKKEGVRKKSYKKVCRTLFLNNNEIRSIDKLFSILEVVMNFPAKLKFLDLSFNYLTTIDEEILNFPELKTLYLHGNYIYQLEEVKKLSDLSQLLALTLHGNPIEQISGYRQYVLGIIYSKYETLKKLDSVVVTRKEKEG
mmetsp:Transcript_4990/g.5880  ORF Transcript_4990/g.5880 Transcript_4990/m.5880 type:complete len:228 (-) Transcript_4990:154-837(-)